MFYRALLILHSWNRWIILVLGLVLVIASLKSWLGRSESKSAVGQGSLWFVISVDVQLLLGIVLYFVSPIMTTFFQNPGAAMEQASIRFWAVEHTVVMLLATVLVHVGRVMVKKAAEPRQANRRGAILFSVAYLLILVGVPWPFLPWGRTLFLV